MDRKHPKSPEPMDQDDGYQPRRKDPKKNKQGISQLQQKGSTVSLHEETMKELETQRQLLVNRKTTNNDKKITVVQLCESDSEMETEVRDDTEEFIKNYFGKKRNSDINGKVYDNKDVLGLENNQKVESDCVISARKHQGTQPRKLLGNKEFKNDKDERDYPKLGTMKVTINTDKINTDFQNIVSQYLPENEQTTQEKVVKPKFNHLQKFRPEVRKQFEEKSAELIRVQNLILAGCEKEETQQEANKIMEELRQLRIKTRQENESVVSMEFISEKETTDKQGNSAEKLVNAQGNWTEVVKRSSPNNEEKGNRQHRTRFNNNTRKSSVSNSSNTSSTGNEPVRVVDESKYYSQHDPYKIVQRHKLNTNVTWEELNYHNTWCRGYETIKGKIIQKDECPLKHNIAYEVNGHVVWYVSPGNDNALIFANDAQQSPRIFLSPGNVILSRIYKHWFKQHPKIGRLFPEDNRIVLEQSIISTPHEICYTPSLLEGQRMTCHNVKETLKEELYLKRKEVEIMNGKLQFEIQNNITTQGKITKDLQDEIDTLHKTLQKQDELHQLQMEEIRAEGENFAVSSLCGIIDQQEAFLDKKTGEQANEIMKLEKENKEMKQRLEEILLNEDPESVETRMQAEVNFNANKYVEALEDYRKQGELLNSCKDTIKKSETDRIISEVRMKKESGELLLQIVNLTKEITELKEKNSQSKQSETTKKTEETVSSTKKSNSTKK